MLPAVHTDEELRAMVGDETDPALLHTEVMREHFVVHPDHWTLGGVLDFEPAMIGDAAYDFGALGVFTSRGDARLLGPYIPVLCWDIRSLIMIVDSFGRYGSARQHLAIGRCGIRER